jgi:hypothetical protein
MQEFDHSVKAVRETITKTPPSCDDEVFDFEQMLLKVLLGY